MSASGPGPLHGRAALVTGAARRVGRAIAERLAAAGANVALHAHGSRSEAESLARGLTERGGRHLALHADLRDERAAQQLVEDAWSAFGGLDLLVNNVGAFERSPLQTLDADAFDRMVTLNARTVYLLSTFLGRRMKARGRGAIVNVACVSGLKAWGGAIPYSASKAAVVSLTHGFARALAPEVRVNAVAPGPVLEPEGMPPAERERIAATTLLRRWGTPDDVAEAVLLLATEPFLTGVILPVDGGRSSA
jgi:pteridine reductase